MHLLLAMLLLFSYERLVTPNEPRTRMQRPQ